MQVALVCNKRFGTDGISMFVLNNYRHFSHDGINYHLVYPDVGGDAATASRYLHAFAANGDSTKLIEKRRGLWSFGREFMKYLHRNQIDVMHVHGSSSAVLMEVVLAKLGG